MSKRPEHLSTSRFFKVYLIIASATPMLSTDFYLPALPAISAYFRTEDAVTNLTMISFSASIAVCSLVWGPVSDKYGRRRVNVFGGALYFASSLLCALAPTIGWFIVFRLMQGVGGGAIFMASTAFVKDVYVKDEQERILSLVQGMALIGPAVAPTIGALILKLGEWHGIFLLMTALGGIVFAGALAIPETLRSPLVASLPATFGRLWVVFRNPRFCKVVLIFTMPSIAMMAFINASPYVFQNRFGVSEQAYSLFFAASALAMMAGSLFSAPVSRRVGHTAVSYACLTVVTASGVLILALGDTSPYALIAFIVPSSFLGSMVRPICVYLALNAQEGDTGSASSLIGFVSLMFASLGMVLLSRFDDYLLGLGVLFTAVGAAQAVLFIVFLRRV